MEYLILVAVVSTLALYALIIVGCLKQPEWSLAATDAYVRCRARIASLRVIRNQQQWRSTLEAGKKSIHAYGVILHDCPLIRGRRNCSTCAFSCSYCLASRASLASSIDISRRMRSFPPGQSVVKIYFAPGRCAEPNRSLRKDGDRIADANLR